MKDQVFSGRTVAEALEAAGRTLGLAPDAIRYVVLERESPGAMGVGGTEARIAVLLESGRAPAGSGPAPAPEHRRSSDRPRDAQAAIRAFVREFAETSQLDLTAEVQQEGERTVVTLFGDDRALLLENGGEVLIALEHIIQRAFARDVPGRLVVDCEGFRASRDAGLESRAREIAGQVRADGRPRETEPLNAYERRIVHVTLAEEAGIRTFSVGEGADRRVTIALKEAADDEENRGNS
jgi:spoIIIJ-associated protein